MKRLPRRQRRIVTEVFSAGIAAEVFSAGIVTEVFSAGIVTEDILLLHL